MNISRRGFKIFNKAVFITIQIDFKATGGFDFAWAVFFTGIGRFVILGIISMFAFFKSLVFGLDDTSINDANTACFDKDVKLG